MVLAEHPGGAATGAWTADQLAILADDRLTAEARIVGLLVSHAGESGLGYDELEALITDASRERLRRAVGKLERCKWVLRTVGGRGHGDRFTLIASAESTPYRAYRVAILNTLSDTLPETQKLSPVRYPQLRVSKTPSSSSSVPPPPPPLGAGVREAIDSSLVLRPCRDQLVAYLELGRSEQPLEYVRSVEGALSGLAEHLWRDQFGGSWREARAELVAGCLNEIAQGDEIGKYFPGPPGDFSNLAGKIRYRVKANAGAKNDAERRRTSGSPRGESKGGEPTTRRRTKRVTVEGL